MLCLVLTFVEHLKLPNVLFCYLSSSFVIYFVILLLLFGLFVCLFVCLN